VTVIVGTRECCNCAWGDLRTEHQGVGVPSGNSGIGGELTIPVDVVFCHRHDEKMAPGDWCKHWRSEKTDD